MKRGHFSKFSPRRAPQRTPVGYRYYSAPDAGTGISSGLNLYTFLISSFKFLSPVSGDLWYSSTKSCRFVWASKQCYPVKGGKEKRASHFELCICSYGKLAPLSPLFFLTLSLPGLLSILFLFPFFSSSTSCNSLPGTSQSSSSCSFSQALSIFLSLFTSLSRPNYFSLPSCQMAAQISDLCLCFSLFL